MFWPIYRKLVSSNPTTYPKLEESGLVRKAVHPTILTIYTSCPIAFYFAIGLLLPEFRSSLSGDSIIVFVIIYGLIMLQLNRIYTLTPEGNLLMRYYREYLKNREHVAQ
jgi:hypothetical protein